MSEFEMPKGRNYRRFDVLDSFTQGYIMAAFWTIDEELSDKTMDDLAPETLARFVKDSETFQGKNHMLLQMAYERDYSEERAGHDFWLTRNGHGAGYWAREELEADKLGDKLTTACTSHSIDLYEGDDGKLYLM